MLEVSYTRDDQNVTEVFSSSDVRFWERVGKLSKDCRVWSLTAREDGEDFIFSEKLEEVLF